LTALTPKEAYALAVAARCRRFGWGLTTSRVVHKRVAMRLVAKGLLRERWVGYEITDAGLATEEGNDCTLRSEKVVPADESRRA
jgi:hypothetical protein